MAISLTLDFDRIKKLDRKKVCAEERAEFWRSVSVLQMRNVNAWDPQNIQVTVVGGVQTQSFYPNYDRKVVLKPQFNEDVRVNPRIIPAFKKPFENCSLQDSMRLAKWRDDQDPVYEYGQGFAYFWRTLVERHVPTKDTYIEQVLAWAYSNREEAKILSDILLKEFHKWEKEEKADPKVSRKDTYPEATKLLKQRKPFDVAPYNIKKAQVPPTPASSVEAVINFPAYKLKVLLPPRSFVPVEPIQPQPH